jgi:hypothetical protein
MSGWGDQPQSRQGDDQYTIEYTPPAPHTPSPAFDFPFHYQSEPDYRTDGSQLQSSWAASQSQARPDDTTSFPAGPSSQASWSSQQPWEGHGDQPATLGGLQPYHHPHRDGLGTAAITTHTHPQSSGPPSLQDQLIYPRPRRLSDLVLPEYISAWRVLEVDAIPATNVAASHATLNSSSSDNNSGSMSAMPSVTDPSHNAFNNVVHHSNIVSFPHRVRAPDSSTRSNRRNTKLTTTKRTASKTSIAPMGLDFIPYGIEGLLEQCNTTMKETAFARSLLPSPEALKEMIDFSWRTVSQNQTDGKFDSLSNIK